MELVTNVIEELYRVHGSLMGKMVLCQGAFTLSTIDRGFHKELEMVHLWNQAKKPLQNPFVNSILLQLFQEFLPMENIGLEGQLLATSMTMTIVSLPFTITVLIFSKENKDDVKVAVK